MKKIQSRLLVVCIILMFSINAFCQENNSFYTHVSDSAGYQSYYAIEIFKKGKPFKSWYREAKFMKFYLKRKLVVGRWYFKSYPDTIVIKRKNEEEDIVIAINDISTITFQRSKNYTEGNYAGSTALKIAAVAGGVVSPGVLIRGNKEWSRSYFLLNGKREARIVIKQETEKEKLKREKTEKSL